MQLPLRVERGIARGGIGGILPAFAGLIPVIRAAVGQSVAEEVVTDSGGQIIDLRQGSVISHALAECTLGDHSPCGIARRRLLTEGDGIGIRAPLRFIIICAGRGTVGIGIAVQRTGSIGIVFLRRQPLPAGKGVALSHRNRNRVGITVLAGIRLRGNAAPGTAVADKGNGALVLIRVAENNHHVAGNVRDGIGIAAGHGGYNRGSAYDQIGAVRKVIAAQKRYVKGDGVAVGHGGRNNGTVISVGCGVKCGDRCTVIRRMLQRYAVGVQLRGLQFNGDVAVGAVVYGNGDLRAVLHAGKHTCAGDNIIAEVVISGLRVTIGKLQREGCIAVIVDRLYIVAIHDRVSVVNHGVAGIRGDHKGGVEGLFTPNCIQIDLCAVGCSQVADGFARFTDRGAVCGGGPAYDRITGAVTELIRRRGVKVSVVFVGAVGTVADAHDIVGVIMVNHAVGDGSPLGVKRDIFRRRVTRVAEACLIRVFVCGVPAAEFIAGSAGIGKRYLRSNIGVGPLCVDRNDFILDRGKIRYTLPIGVRRAAAVCGSVPTGELPGRGIGGNTVAFGCAVIIVRYGILAGIIVE